MKNLVRIVIVSSMIAFISCADSKKKNAEMNDIESEEMAATEMSSSVYENTDGISEDAGTIVEVASENEKFSTLVTAIKAAGLVETLEGEGPYTVFAPTNAAFDKLPDGTLDGLLKPDNKDKLENILTYHVVSGSYKAADVMEAIKDNDGQFMIETVEGTKLTLSLDGENVVLKDDKGVTSTVVMTDVAASNGVIHVIDTVVMP